MILNFGKGRNKPIGTYVEANLVDFFKYNEKLKVSLLHSIMRFWKGFNSVAQCVFIFLHSNFSSTEAAAEITTTGAVAAAARGEYIKV